MQQVHLRINDAATGKPTPVRLRITDADGTYYAPFGRLTEFATGVNQDVGGNVMIGAKKWCYIDGTCEILLPPGKLHIEISKGFEYKPIDEEITLLAGKMALRFAIERWCDMRKEGWYSGDTRVHFLSPDAALLEGQAEDVAVVNLLVKEHRGAIPNILSFSGQEFARQAPTCGVAVNTQNVHSELGSLGLLNCHRVIYPLTSDSIAWTLDDWCGQCHRKKGLVTWTEPARMPSGLGYGEPLVNVILGDADAYEEKYLPECSTEEPWGAYFLLAFAGIVVPLVGASGKESNREQLGARRTYAYLGPQQEMTYAAWIEAIRAGRTFVSNGALLHFTIDGVVPGKEVVMKEEGLKVHAEAQSRTPFDLRLRHNGSTLAQGFATNGPPYKAALDYLLPPFVRGGPLWIECLRDDSPQAVACSSAVNVRVGQSASWVFDLEGVEKPLTTDLDKLLAWAKSQQAPRFAGRIEQARTILAEKVSRFRSEIDRS